MGEILYNYTFKDIVHKTVNLVFNPNRYILKSF